MAERVLTLKIIGDSDALVKSLQKAERAGAKYNKSAERMGKTLTRSVTLPLLAAGAASVRSAVMFESSFTGIRKTVDATEQQFDDLAEGMRDMAKEIPVNVNELNRIGEAAGQLGIETENIEDFTRTMAELGVTTNLSSDEAATSLARMANITQTAQGDIERMGSSIVVLGNNMATTEAEIVDMALGMAAAGTQAGLSTADIFAMAASLSSIGIAAQAGGTAISKTLDEIEGFVQKGGRELQVISDVAGMTAEQFATHWEEKPAEAFASFTEGLGRMDAAGESTLGVLEELGITEIRQRKALRGLASASDLLSKSLELSNLGWEENNALAQEAALRFGTTESKMKILGNRVNDIGIELGSTLIPILVDTVDALEPFIEGLGDLAEAFGEMDPLYRNSILALAALAAAAGPAIFVGAKLAQGYAALGAALGIATAADIAKTKATQANTTAQLANRAITQSSIAATSQLGATNLVTAASYSTLSARIAQTTSAEAANALALKANSLSRVAAVSIVGTAALAAAGDLVHLATTMEDEIERTERIIESHGIMASTFDHWGRSLLGADRQLFGLSVGLEKYDKVLEETEEETDANVKAAARLEKEIRELSKASAEEAQVLADVAAALSEVSGLTSEYFDETEQAAKITRDLADAERAVQEQTIENKKLLKDYNDVVAEFGKESDEATLALGRLKDGEDALADSSDAVTKKTGEVNGLLNEEAAQAGLTSAGLQELIDKTKNWKDLPVEEKLVKIRVVGAERLEEANRQIATFKRSGSFRFDANVNNQRIDKRAHGGPVSPNQTFIVGEEGPELFVPDSSGQIIPANKTARALGGSANLNTFRRDSALNEEERRIEDLWQKEMGLWRKQSERLAKDEAKKRRDDAVKAERQRKDDAAALVASLKGQLASKAGLNPFIFGRGAQKDAIQRDIDKTKREQILADRELNDAKFSLAQGLSTRTDAKGNRLGFTAREAQDARFRVADAEDAVIDIRQQVITMQRERDWLVKTLRENNVPGFAKSTAKKVVPIRSAPSTGSNLSGGSQSASAAQPQINMDFRGAIFSAPETQIRAAAKEAANELARDGVLLGRS